jgi:exodeoxyribonuclease VIII
MTHEAILQPDVFSRYVPMPEVDRRTKEGKEMYWEIMNNLESDEIAVDHAEYDFVMNVSDSIKIALEQKGIVFDCTEQVVTNTYNCVPLKCSIDAIAGNVIYDIKTTDDASPGAFLRTVQQYRYNLQSLMYRQIACLDRFVFIVVEKEPPFAVCFYELGNELNAKAFMDFERVTKLYKHCTETNSWEGYSSEIQMLDIPQKSGIINFA